MGKQRECGVLLPISSLPSKYGIGCFSKSAYDFVDQLRAAGQGCWQILPLGPTSYGDSPYQSFSTFAGNPYFISLEDLIEEGVLTEKECDAIDFGNKADEIDYESFTKAVISFFAKHTREAIFPEIRSLGNSSRSRLTGWETMPCLWQ